MLYTRKYFRIDGKCRRKRRNFRKTIEVTYDVTETGVESVINTDFFGV